jgi:hypothetical protein
MDIESSASSSDEEVKLMTQLSRAYHAQYYPQEINELLVAQQQSQKQKKLPDIENEQADGEACD